MNWIVSLFFCCCVCSAKPSHRYLLYYLLNCRTEQSGKLGEREQTNEKEKTITVSIGFGWIQGWLFFLTYSYSHSYSQCVSIWFNFPNDTIQFQGDIRHFGCCCCSYVCFFFISQRSDWIIYAPKKKKEEEEAAASLSMIWRIFRLQQSNIPNNQHTNIFCRKWNANWIACVCLKRWKIELPIYSDHYFFFIFLSLKDKTQMAQ